MELSESTAATNRQNSQRIKTLSEHRLCWKNSDEGGFLVPVWPREPNMDVARKLAIESLSSDKFSNATISAFAEGSFNRLYCVSSPQTTAEYIMRVALPVDPFYKTESEVATMDYIRQHTSIPVPGVVAYSSNSSNELGFEWMLLERIPGVPLHEVWDKMPFEAKMDLTVRLANSFKGLFQRQFPLIGSIYYNGVWNQVDYTPSLSPPPTGDEKASDLDIGTDKTFVIGRMVTNSLVKDKRLLLRPDRGPFKTARELAIAETKLLSQRIRHLSPTPETDYYCEVDEELHEDGDEVLDTVDELLRVVPQVYSAEDTPEDTKVLWHDDVSLQNVLVDPQTYELTGIVDWESVSIVPAWRTGRGIPYFLRGLPVSEPPPVGSVSPEEEEELTTIREDWELTLLRRKYTEIVGPMYQPPQVPDTLKSLKPGFFRASGDFEEGWAGVRYWLKHHFGNKNDADRARWERRSLFDAYEED